MSKWLVRLKGDRFDLEDFSKQLRSPGVKVVKRKDELFYLESNDFNSLTSPKEVLERGRELIKIINGAVKLKRDNFLGISEDVIIRVEDDGKQEGYIYPEEKFKIIDNYADDSEKIVTHPNDLESLIEVAIKCKVVADALSFYQDDTWISLYKAYEIIRDDVGGELQIIKNGWLVKSALKRFTQTAQSRDALGDSARHASKKYKSPAQPMTLLEAKALIKTILSRWVSSKT
jgi:hypothetical protein